MCASSNTSTAEATFHPDLAEQLALHDEMTLPEANCHTSLA